MAKTVRIEEIGGCEGNCITINDTRVAGPKPWGGGYVIKRWDARVDHILQALGVDVAEVVRCKDCKSWEQYNACDGTKPNRCRTTMQSFISEQNQTISVPTEKGEKKHDAL